MRINLYEPFLLDMTVHDFNYILEHQKGLHKIWDASPNDYDSIRLTAKAIAKLSNLEKILLGLPLL